MLNIKINTAILILAVTMLLSSVITYMITTPFIQRSQETTEHRAISNFHKEITIPTYDGERY